MAHSDGRRRVRSLVKNLEDMAPASESSARLSTQPFAESSRSSSASPTRPNAPASYAAAQNSLAFSSDRSPEKHFTPISGPEWAADITASPSNFSPHTSHLASWAPIHDDTVLETPADEKDDVFLPMPSMSSPYKVAFPLTNSGNSSPFSPSFTSSMLPSDRKEHSRRHSRIHSRNLSVFFPQPSDRVIPEENHEQDIPSQLRSSQSGSNSRRGHHHKHSLSHNFFSLVEPIRTDLLSPGESTSSSSTGLSPATPSDAPKAVPSSLSLALSGTSSLPSSSAAASLSAKYAHLPTLVRVILAILFHLPFRTQCALSLAGLQLIIGSALWVYGQSGESLAVTGLGYLIVFDGLGALNTVLVEGNARDIDILWDLARPKSWNRAGERGIRYPFGTYRFTILSQFAQCIFLLFSAVYVCKESIEHVLLLHEPHAEATTAAGSAAHGSAHGSMGHGEVRGGAPKHGTELADLVDAGVAMPTGLLMVATILCLATAILLRNHASLTEAIGPTTYALRPRTNESRSSRQTAFQAVMRLLSNPFSLLVLTFSSALCLASVAISGVQLAPLDKVLALLQSLAMFYVAYPAAEVTGKVLLQTAPPEDASNMVLLKQGLQDVNAHHLITHVAKPKVWQLTPHPRQNGVDFKASTKLGKSWRNVQSKRAAASVVVATIDVSVQANASDRNILEVTQFVRERCSPAFRGGEGQPPGELTVIVRRHGEPIHSDQDGCSGHAESNSHLHQNKAYDQHAHSHSHSHSHSHTHSHASTHSHAH